jgi:hypothetical protein
MAETKDIVLDAATTHAYTGVSSGAGANSIDSNYSTYQGIDLSESPSSSSSTALTVVSQHTWVTPKQITSVAFRVYVRSAYHAEYECFECSILYRVQYLPSGGSWTTFSNSNASYYKNNTTSQHGGSFYTFDNSIDAGAVTFSETVSDVVGIRITAQSVINGTGGGGSWRIQNSRIYEVHALCEKLVDSGLYVRKSGSNVSIGCNDLNSTHKLRVCTADGVKGIPLVALSSSNASALRIRDTSAIKALPIADT